MCGFEDAQVQLCQQHGHHMYLRLCQHRGCFRQPQRLASVTNGLQHVDGLALPRWMLHCNPIVTTDVPCVMCRCMGSMTSVNASMAMQMAGGTVQRCLTTSHYR